MSERVAVHQGEHIETLELKKKKKGILDQKSHISRQLIQETEKNKCNYLKPDIERLFQ